MVIQEARTLELVYPPVRLDVIEPKILNIRDQADVRQAVELASFGFPIAYIGGGVYGLGGTAEAFTVSHNGIPSISEMKDNRDFYSNPPIALPSWSMLDRLVDWDEISGQEIGFNKEGVKAFVRNIYEKLPLHLVLPIKAESEKMLPFALWRDSRDVLCHAFMCCRTVVPLQSLIDQFEEVTKDVLLATSANPSGAEPFTTYQQVVESFPQVPFVLTDPIFEGGTTGNSWCSYTMYDLVNFPGLIEYLRGGNVSHDLMVKMMLKAGFKPNLVFSNVQILADLPAIESFETAESVFR